MNKPLRIGILTVSDRSYRAERADLSGPALVYEIHSLGWQVARTGLLPDERSLLEPELLRWAGEDTLDVILTTGGTGFSPRDVTPEATLAVVDRLAPGLAEAMRAASLSLTPHAMLSRAAAGICRNTLILNLPGSPKAAVENLPRGRSRIATCCAAAAFRSGCRSRAFEMRACLDTTLELSLELRMGYII